MTDDGRKDFDFYFGHWRIDNRRLAKRLAGCTEWQHFVAHQECRPVLGGLGNLDAFSTTAFVDGNPLEGLTLRLFDPAARTWSIYWSDDRCHQLQPPVIGRWTGDRGTFEGDDTFEGRPIRVRFLWTRGAEPTWEQAFSTDGGATWETNWYMGMTRLDRPSAALGDAARLTR
jgi:hypothetical protein